MDVRAEYERKVRALAARADEMRREGADLEAVARALHAERRALSTKYKDLTPEPQRTQVHNRTVAAYGDPLGPTVEQLRANGRSWDEIIESASRPGDFGKVLRS
jgi:hypothetical protein